MAGPSALHGLRVIELGSLIGAPFCGALLAEFGAEVLKVEDPKVGDAGRHFGRVADGTSLYFVHLTRNKKCITLDLRRPEGQTLLKRLVPRADVVLENFRPGTLAAWDLDYPTLARVNPRLIMAHVSGFGQYGPYAPRAAFDRIATAFAGEDYITGFPDKPPTRPGGALADYMAGLFCTIGVMFAVYHRDVNGGRGQEIDLALYEGLFRLMGQVEEYGAFGVVPARRGNANPLIAPAETFRTRDGEWMALHAATDNVWRRLLDVMGRPELDQDPRFHSQRGRAEHQDALHPVVGEWIAQHNAEPLFAAFEKAGVPATRINSIADIFRDPHIRARENIVRAALPSGRTIETVGVVPRLTVTPGRVESVAPPLGAHNEEVYRGVLGLSAEEYESLRERGII
ncbi:MAG: CoA transferase [Candidatus Rokubacteria bacterium]|nr:CoA transferase [Candidatus Rokubacteria bacterium]